MRKILRNRRISAFIASGVFIGLYISQFVNNWPLLRNSGILGTKRYVDLFAIQDFSTRVNSLGFEIYKFSENGSGYQYSIGILYIFDLFKLNQISREVAAMVLEVPLLILLTYIVTVTFLKSFRLGVLSILLLSSPGIWLLLERGNLDIVMILLIALAGWTFKTKYEFIGFLALVSSVLTKFYTAPLLILFVIYGKKKYSRLVYAFTTILLAIFTMFQISRVATFPSTWYVSFGSGSIGHWINLFFEYKIVTNFRINEITGSIIGLAMLGIATSLHLKKFSKRPFSVNSENKNFENLADFFALTFLACYIFGMNYDYRLIIPILAVIFFLMGKSNLPLRMYLICVTVMSAWLSCYFFGLTRMAEVYFQLLGDIFIGLLASYFSAYYILKFSKDLKIFIKLLK